MTLANTIHVLNGPNLNLLGERQPEIYGHDSLADVEKLCTDACHAGGADLSFKQSNAEHVLVDWIQQARKSRGVVLNPAGFTTTSISIRDALLTCTCPVYEVHISNIYKREPFRQGSYVSGAANGVIAGCGVRGYTYAIAQILSQ